MTYVASVDLGDDAGGSRVLQVVCSPFRNPLDSRERRVVRVTGSRAAAALFCRLARLCGVESAGASWELTRERTFDNSIGELELDGTDVKVTLFDVQPNAETRLRVAHCERY
jgi:hypothetical protein